MTFADRYAAFLSRFRFVVVALWLMAGITGAFFTLRFIHNTTEEFTPPSGTQSHKAMEAMRVAFPGQTDLSHFSIFIEGPDCTTRAVERFISGVFDELMQLPFWTKVSESTNYFELNATNATALAAQLVAQNGTAMAVPIVFSAPFTSREAADFGKQLVDIVARQPLHSAFSASVMGLPVFISDIIGAVGKDMGIMDAIVMPLALAVMSVTIGSLRLMILPLVTVGLTLVCSFSIMYVISLFTVVSTSTPSLMMSLAVAMSIDYNLFILSRYMEELRGGLRGSAVISNVVNSSGRTVFVSGLTLILSFMGLIFFPLSILRSFGYGCALTILFAMAVSLTFVPSFLLTFPGVFEGSIVPIRKQPWYTRLRRCCRCGTAPNDSADAESKSPLSSKSPVRVPSAASFHRYQDADARSSQTSLWDPEGQWDQSVFYKVRHLLRLPWSVAVLLLLLGISGGVAVVAFRFQPTDSFTAYLPRGSPVSDSFNTFAATFGFGYTEPYTILFQRSRAAPPAVNVITPEFFAYAQGLLREIAQRSEELPSASKLSSIFGIDGQWTTYETVFECFNGTALACDRNVFVLRRTVNADRSAVTVIDTTTREPTGNAGTAYYHGMLAIISDYQNATRPYSGNWSVYIDGVGPSSLDAMDAIFTDLPYIIAATGAAVLIVVGVAFRSIVVPLRSILSVAATEGFVFGVCVATFQLGLLDFLHWPNLGGSGAVSFASPVVGFTVVVGVALDYDIFLLTRVHDIIASGWSDTTTAVLQGLCHTGRIITAAGIIMAIAFFGLVLSSVGVLNILGWFLCVAVLFDTFLVRTFMVPTMMSLLGRWNWWPSRNLRDFIR